MILPLLYRSLDNHLASLLQEVLPTPRQFKLTETPKKNNNIFTLLQRLFKTIFNKK